MTAMSVEAQQYEPSRDLPARLRRRLTQWQAVAPLPARPPQAMISFTFDDFPRSAAETGASILDRFGAKGCYYACTGMLGETGPSGPFFIETDIMHLEQGGHEIGAHTVSHLDCARASTSRALNDISHNVNQLKALGVTTPVRQFAYPYGETHTELKRALAERFDACRGVLSGVNSKGSDAMQLRAFELGSDESSVARAVSLIEAAARQPAWLVFFTHGVRDKAGKFDVKPQALSALVRRARDSGAALITPSQAIDQIMDAA
ncbi:MAG: polysaccharide deacetylase family protein [Hyphomonadaceae bacterium]|nr:polysaccharide deacetylase family protein [Hyphomonadaceae bacterium]